MNTKNIALTDSEWNLMECLWKNSPRSGREVIDELGERVGWSRSTTLTMLRRMTEKGVISCDESGGMKMYAPIVEREAAVSAETDDFLKRVYKGSVSMMVSTLTRKQKLTTEEIDELYEILRRAEEGEK